MEVGIDIVSVYRIEKAIITNEKFLHKVYTENEIKYCESKKNKYQSYAARFAAKEAFAKAIGKGFKEGLSFKDIEVLNDENGKPYINYKNKKIKLSISHEKDYAIAMILLED